MKKRFIKRLKTGLMQEWYRQNIIIMLIGLILSSSLSLGYSILSQNLDISGEVVIRADKDIRITAIESNIINCGYDIYNPKFNEDSIAVNLSLPELGCTIQYNVVVTNKGLSPIELVSIINESYNNENIIYTINGYDIGDILSPDDSVSFNVLFKYNPSISQLPNNIDLGAVIKFIWQIHDNSDDDIIDPKIFVYKNGCEEYVIPKDGLYKIEAWGANGGAVTTSTFNSKGGYSKGIAVLTAGETIYVCVGGQGESNATANYVNQGGFNGGGTAKNSSGTGIERTGGGGATDVRVLSNTLYNRIVVAGGGGGNSSHTANCYGGNGGGITGANGGASSALGYGGSQTSGGKGQVQEGTLAGFGIGGSQPTSTVGGGGGGWYGGGNGNGAGGGSGYVLTQEATIPTSYFSQYTNYYLYDALNLQYGNSGYIYNPDSSGNGYAIISHININLNLIGESEITIQLGDTYIDNGATLKIDGINQSSSIVKTGTVNTSIAGTYTINYKYTEPLTGKVYSVNRKVIVEEKKEYAANFPYTGTVQTIVAPYTGKYKLEVWGAQGGGTTGAQGGYSTGIVTLQKGEILYVYVGGQGIISTSGGGFNGGGNPTNTTYYGGGGGTDIRIGTDSLYSRVIVAGGGGGERSTYASGYGGGDTGGNSVVSNIVSIGGTQTTGGASQQGGSWSNYVTNGSFGLGGSWISSAGTLGGFSGGGGGWYGGGAGHGGAGGSGYVYTQSTATNYPSGGLLNSKYYLEDAYTSGGNIQFKSPTNTDETGHFGNGYAKVKFIDNTPTNPDPDPDPPVQIVKYDLTYTGSVQTVTLAPGKYKLEVWGAQGGGGSTFYPTAIGGKGGYSSAILTLTSTTTVYVHVGGKGMDYKDNGVSDHTTLDGGYNGGGLAAVCYSSAIASGGGGSDIRLENDTLYNRIIVAGGGGAAGSGYTGGAGGGNTAGDGTGNYGKGGSQSSGGTGTYAGSFGLGGGIGYTSSDPRINGGGGGWYGGAGNQYSAGGGSGYILTSTSYRPSGYAWIAGDNKYAMTNSVILLGTDSIPNYDGTSTMTGNTGNGHAKISSIK